MRHAKFCVGLINMLYYNVLSFEKYFKATKTIKLA